MSELSEQGTAAMATKLLYCSNNSHKKCNLPSVFDRAASCALDRDICNSVAASTMEHQRNSMQV